MWVSSKPWHLVFRKGSEKGVGCIGTGRFKVKPGGAWTGIQTEQASLNPAVFGQAGATRNGKLLQAAARAPLVY